MGGDELSSKNRAEYFKERRLKLKTFSVVVEREKMEQFEKRLQEKGQTKAAWLNRKIDEELGR